MLLLYDLKLLQCNQYFFIRMDLMTTLMWRGLLLVVRIIAQICNFSCIDCFGNFQQVVTLFSVVSVRLSVRLMVCQLDYTKTYERISMKLDWKIVLVPG